MTDGFRSGFVALFGKPNAGKSTLLNQIIGERLAAVSALPQTTRERFQGIYTDESCQIVFVDLPGMIGATDRLNECLRVNVFEGIGEVDVIIHLVDVADDEPINEDVEAALALIRSPMVLAVNKIDGRRANVDAGSWAGERIPASIRNRYSGILGISATRGSGVDELLKMVATKLPEGPPLYDPDILTDRDMRFLAQEMIREQAYKFLHEELPYAIAVEIDEFKERETGKWYIRATLHVERDSQKGMVIGKKGETLKKISQSARKEIERICDAAVFLDLWVKVKPKWRKNDSDLRRFGFKPPK